MLVSFETSRLRETFVVETEGETDWMANLAPRLRVWLAATVSRAEAANVCLSWTCSVHPWNANCDHETDPRKEHRP
jgi:hypothetical protein